MRTFIARGGLAVLFVGVVASGNAGCNAMYNDETSSQCHSEQDCRARGPEFANTTCSAERVCVPIPPSSQACSTNQECTNQNGGSPARCLPSTHKCVSLASPECSQVFGEKSELLDDNAIFIGTTHTPDIGGVLIPDGAELARSQIQTVLGGGLPAVQPGGPKRPLVIVNCPSLPTSTGISSLPAGLRGISHLVRNVQVPSVIGMNLPDSSIAAVPQIITPGNAISWIVGAVTNAVTDGANGRAFQMASLDIDTTRIAPYLVTESLEPRAAAEGMIVGGEPLRVMVIRGLDATSVYMGEYLAKNLRFNNLAALDNGSNFLLHSIPDTGNRIDNPDTPANFTKAIVAATGYKPHIIFIASQPSVVAALMPNIDTQWPAGVPKPFFVSTAQSAQNVVVAAIGRNESLRKRYMGLEGIPVGFEQKEFDDRLVADFKIKFPEVPNVSTQAGFSYDAVYLTAYAAIAAGAAELNGQTLAQAVRKATSGGPTIKVGQTDMATAVQALQAGGGLTVIGTTGPITFNPSGTRQYNARTFCVSGVNGTATAITRPGYSLDIGTGKTTGSPVCP
jgi:ABC-type branched-subunit amino acid transport system substrate-binding protein